MRARKGEAQETLLRFLLTSTDDCLLWPFSLNTAGYGQVGSGKGSIPAHMSTHPSEMVCRCGLVFNRLRGTRICLHCDTPCLVPRERDCARCRTLAASNEHRGIK